MNWPALISNIQAAGLSQPQIARVCGCAQSTISDLVAGKTKDPRYSIGLALQELARKTKQSPAPAGESTQTALPLSGKGVAHVA